jgi:DNA-binding NarL/FixJ family response regulator
VVHKRNSDGAEAKFRRMIVEPTAENLSERAEQKRKATPQQVEANRKNGRLGGLGRRKRVGYVDIARLKRDGYSVQQIGSRLGVSRWTVQRRIAEALRF